MTRDLLTASRMNKLLDCPRAHFWSYEIGLKPQRSGDALRFGSAWHRAMESLAKSWDYDAAIIAAAADKDVPDEFTLATIAGLLSGYMARYESQPIHTSVSEAEIEFRRPIAGSRSFDAAGKIDRFLVFLDRRSALMEHKTTGDSLDDGSDYWLRLRANPQILQYALEVRERYGRLPDVVLYDVVRKPEISPRSAVPDLDEQGRKIVLNADGTRAMNSRTVEPKASANAEKGERMSTHAETPEEFAARLRDDTITRPDFYFARREVTLLESDIEEFIANRLAIGRMILGYRQDEKRVACRHMAWPKHLHDRVCQSCEYKSFCLQNLTPDLQHPPTGFVVGEKFSELAEVTKGQ